MVFWRFVPARATKTVSVQIWIRIGTTEQNHGANTSSDETTVYVLQVSALLRQFSCPRRCMRTGQSKSCSIIPNIEHSSHFCHKRPWFLWFQQMFSRHIVTICYHFRNMHGHAYKQLKLMLTELFILSNWLFNFFFFTSICVFFYRPCKLALVLKFGQGLRAFGNVFLYIIHSVKRLELFPLAFSTICRRCSIPAC